MASLTSSSIFVSSISPISVYDHSVFIFPVYVFILVFYVPHTILLLLSHLFQCSIKCSLQNLLFIKISSFQFFVYDFASSTKFYIPHFFYSVFPFFLSPFLTQIGLLVFPLIFHFFFQPKYLFTLSLLFFTSILTNHFCLVRHLYVFYVLKVLITN